MRALEAIHRSGKRNITFYREDSLKNSGTAFLAPETVDFFIEKIVREKQNGLIVFCVNDPGEFPQRFTEFALSTADVMLTLSSDHPDLIRIAAQQRIKVMGVFPTKLPPLPSLKLAGDYVYAEALLFVRRRRNSQHTYHASQWDICRKIRLPIVEQTAPRSILPHH